MKPINKKRISNTKSLIAALNLTVTEKEELLLAEFLKKKIIHIVDNKIVYPSLQEIKKKKEEMDKNILKIEKEISFWKGTKNQVERNKALFPITIYFKKNFWRHKIKEMTNKEYKQDVIDTRLNDKILLDPEYSTLFETFLVNPDYRKKLKETVNTSIVYKNSSIGGYSEKKKDFKIKTSEMKLEQLRKQLEEYHGKREVYLKIIEILKKYS
jgi:hypothetical protein